MSSTEPLPPPTAMILQAPEALSLEAAIMTGIIDLQVLLDKSHMSVENQGQIMQAIFGTFQSQPSLTNSGSKDYRDLSLGRLLSLAGPNWNGDLGGVHAPTSWEQLTKLYKGLGMLEPQKWRLCTGDKEASHAPVLMKPHKEDCSDLKLKCLCVPRTPVKHRRDCRGCCEKCPTCLKMRKDVFSFEYLSIIGLLTTVCLSRSLCHENLELWRNKDAWKDLPSNFEPATIKEFWDGSKLREYAAFWDPEMEWEVPVICPSPTCRRTFRAFPESQKCEELRTGWKSDRNIYSFPCSLCSALVEAPKWKKKGDPRNFALLGQWDGFQSARTRQRPCWTVNVQILNAGRISSVGPIPVLFISAGSDKIIRHEDASVLNIFLEPFIEDLEKAFITGFPVTYAYPAHLISEHLELAGSDESITLHAMLMMFTGDLKAQCKVGILRDGGYGGCRRHYVRMQRRRTAPTSRANWVYCNSRREVRYPCPPRSSESLLAAAVEWLELHPGRERLEVERRGGISGYSIMWRLYYLYGFDMSLDLVHDVMHTLSLNILKKYVTLLVESMTVVGQMDELERALAIATQYRPQGLGGRWPRKLKCLGFYKAEEYQLFVMWCLPYILDHLDLRKDSVLGALGMILIEICRLYYTHTRKYGWTKVAMDSARELFAAWRVRMEESSGPNSSPLEHIAGSGELVDDVLRHGCHDIFWCYPFERQVSEYMAIPTNRKLNEVSYLHYFRRQFFTRIFSYVKIDRDGMLPHGRALKEVHKFLFKSQQVYTPDIEITSACSDWHGDRAIVVSSQDMARNLSKVLPMLESCPCRSLIEEKGICVGPKVPVLKQATSAMALYLKDFWTNQGHLTNARMRLFTLDLCRLSFVLIRGIEYRVGDLVLVEPDGGSTDHAWTWKAKILAFYIHELHGKMQVFFEASYFEQRMHDHASTRPLVHHITGMQILSVHPTETSLRPVQQLLYKFMQLPIPQRHYVVAYELEDIAPRTHLLEAGQAGCVPPFPEINDIMLVKKDGWKDGDPFSYAVVLGVHSSEGVNDETVVSRGPPVELDQLVGTVELCLLYQIGPRSRRFVAVTGGEYTCSWHKLVKQVLAFKVTKFLHGKPIEWELDV